MANIPPHSAASEQNPLNHEDAVVHYTIDSEDIIRSVSPLWDKFALKNAGENVLAAEVIGRSIWDFVINVETRHLYQTIAAQIRSGRLIAKFPFRCDSPDRRRYMQMEMRLANAGGIEFVSEILREELREPVALLDQHVPRSDKFLVMCSWCKKIEIAGGWIEVEEAIVALQLFGEEASPRISHTMCDACLELYTQDTQ